MKVAVSPAYPGVAMAPLVEQTALDTRARRFVMSMLSGRVNGLVAGAAFEAVSLKSSGPLVLLVTRNTVTTLVTPGPVVVGVPLVSSVRNISFLSTLKVVSAPPAAPGAELPPRAGDERMTVCATPLTL